MRTQCTRYPSTVTVMICSSNSGSGKCMISKNSSWTLYRNAWVATTRTATTTFTTWITSASLHLSFNHPLFVLNAATENPRTGLGEPHTCPIIRLKDLAASDSICGWCHLKHNSQQTFLRDQLRSQEVNWGQLRSTEVNWGHLLAIVSVLPIVLENPEEW